MADKGHKALFNDFQVLISWGKEHHRLKKKKSYRFHKLPTAYGGHQHGNKCAFISLATVTPEK